MDEASSPEEAFFDGESAGDRTQIYKRKWVASCENNVVFPRPPVECAYPPLSRRAFWAESLHAGGKRCFDRDPPRLRHVLPREPGVKGERVGRRSLRAAGHRRQVGV